MTARKNFKRLVRARARKTGESCAAALSHFDEEVPAAQRNATTTLHDLRRVEKPEYGFALRVPDDWKELPPDLRNSAWEVARFSANDPAIRARHRNCLVFRNPAPTGVDAHTAARNAQPVLEVGGFGNFTHLDAVLAGRPGARIDFDRRAGGGIWAVRNYYLVVEDVTFCVGLGTTAPEHDAALLDTLASGFELIGDLANATARPSIDRSPRFVEKPEYGFALRLPERWMERAPQVKSNPWEVARFAEAGDGRHICFVTRRPRPDRSTREAAEEDLESLTAGGFANFRFTTASLAGRSAARLDYEQRDAGRIWAGRHYYLAVDGISFVLHLGSSVPEEDAGLFDDIAAGFRLLAPAQGAGDSRR